ncbi:uncharacterized protein EI90DRAFT_3040232 [Cantharellus anzutake]|uniref:uncharacterized protein n=1 Tax=Cantharellus anzutake TaxID=1750568 RepID=UPI0019081F11|nr:uncharacterized protein EI90DRAFT_3040232 [Cantharellus anzutake]KAF8339085.1 hypothetical protein EI90DRAFT_3040232 [Cantharellus anzutake]
MTNHADTIRTLTLLDPVGGLKPTICFPRLVRASICSDNPILGCTTAPNVEILELLPASYAFGPPDLDEWKSAKVLILGEPFLRAHGFDSLLQLRVHVPSHKRMEAQLLDILARPRSVDNLTWFCPKLRIFEIFVFQFGELIGLSWPGRLPVEPEFDKSSYHPSMTSTTDLYRTDWEGTEDWEESDLDLHSEDLEQDSGGIIPLNEDEEAERAVATTDGLHLDTEMRAAWSDVLSSPTSVHGPDDPPRSSRSSSSAHDTSSAVLDWDLIRTVVEGKLNGNCSSISKLVVKRGRFVTQDLAPPDDLREWFESLPELEFVVDE